MSAVLQLFVSFVGQVFGLLLGVTFVFGSITVSLGAVFFAFLVVSFVINAFWKGAKT